MNPVNLLTCAMDDILKNEHFTDEIPPLWPCPKCTRGVLTLEDGKFRLKLTFSQKVALNDLTVALTCGKKPAQSYRGDLGKTGLFSLPVKAPTNEVCTFSFPLGVKDTSGKLRSVPGEWLLRAGMPKASEEDLYYLALRGVSCGNRSFWDTAKAQKKY